LYDDACPEAAVASRKFRAVRGSRCYCSWHRRCGCYGRATVSPRGAGDGDTLSQAEYNGAGFLGDVPPDRAPAVAAARDRDTVLGSLELLSAFAAVALLLGLLKALWPRYRAHWLWMVNSNWLFELDAYKEPELRPCRLIRDDHGYYVHPVTGSRNIRLLDCGQEFIINVLFFLNLPATLCLYYGRSARYSGSGGSRRDCPDHYPDDCPDHYPGDCPDDNHPGDCPDHYPGDCPDDNHPGDCPDHYPGDCPTSLRD